MALSIKLQLELNGYNVEMFTDPALALAQYGIAPTSYDLIISDMKMTQMSAFEFMRSLKAINDCARILLITQFQIKNEEFSKILPTSRVNGFVEKLHVHRQLISTVKKILDTDGYSDRVPGLGPLDKP